MRDLTEKRKSEDAVKKYVKDLEELITHKDNILSILSHDLRSPLARIIETIDYLLLSIVDMEHDKVKETIGNIQKASLEELAMLDYLLRWARIRFASDAFSPVKIELFQFVEKVISGLADETALKKINLYNEVEKNNGEIWVESMEGVGSTFYFTLPVNAPLEKTADNKLIELDKYPVS